MSTESRQATYDVRRAVVRSIETIVNGNFQTLMTQPEQSRHLALLTRHLAELDEDLSLPAVFD